LAVLIWIYSLCSYSGLLLGTPCRLYMVRTLILEWTVICRGGLPIYVRGHNFDSIYTYSGFLFISPSYPYIGIWVGHEITYGPEFFVWARTVFIVIRSISE